MQDLGSLLNKSIQRAGITRQVGAVQVIKIAEEVLSEKMPANLASQVRPVYLRHKTLYIASLASIASQELQFIQDDVIYEINKRICNNAVEKIRFSV